MTKDLEAAAVSVRLRRLWLGPVLRSPELAGSDLADAALNVTLRRVASTLVVGTPYDFGSGDPFGGEFGDFLRSRVAKASNGTVRALDWEYDPSRTPPRRPQTNDLDIYEPRDPPLGQYPDITERLRQRIPAATPDAAREVLSRVRLVAVSEHRLWFATPSATARDALGTVPGARGALVSAIQSFQKHERPLYRVVVDASYRGASARLA